MAEVKGLTVLKLHYTADPAKATDEWAESAKAGYPQHKWDREMEMDAHAGALLAVFGKSYKPAIHERHLTPIPHLAMRNGWDFGQGFPARVWTQRTMGNALRVYASRVGEAIQLRPFVEQMLAYELNLFGDLWPTRRDYCDPAGNQAKDDGMKSVEVLREFGLMPRWRGSRVEEGLEEIERLLTTNEPETGEPMFAIDPRYNPILCRGFRSAYRRNAQGEIEREHPIVDAMDAFRYIVVNTKTPERPHHAPARPFAVNEYSGYGRAPMPAPMIPTLVR